MRRLRKARASRLWPRLWLLSAIHGIMFGRLKAETYEVMFQLAALPAQGATNPEEEDLVEEMARQLHRNAEPGSDGPAYEERETWRRLPWSSRRPRIVMHRFLGAIISFTDDYAAPFPKEFFPVELMGTYIQGVISRSGSLGRPLSIPEQFEEALALAEGHPTAAALLAHFAARAIGRNHDHRVDSRLIFTASDMELWARSTAHFKEELSPQFDPMGDTYHFWGHCAAGMILEAFQSRYPLQTRFYGAFYYNGPLFMHFARTYIARRPIHTDHRQVDRMALRVGHGVARTFLAGRCST